MLLSFLTSFDKKVSKHWPTSCLQRRFKCQPIPSKNSCISICASPLCATSLASYQSCCPTVAPHPGVHPVLWRHMVSGQLPFNHVERIQKWWLPNQQQPGGVAQSPKTTGWEGTPQHLSICGGYTEGTDSDWSVCAPAGSGSTPSPESLKSHISLCYVRTVKFVRAWICTDDTRTSRLKAKVSNAYLSQNIGPAVAWSAGPTPPPLMDRLTWHCDGRT